MPKAERAGASARIGLSLLLPTFPPHISFSFHPAHLKLQKFTFNCVCFSASRRKDASPGAGEAGAGSGVGGEGAKSEVGKRESNFNLARSASVGFGPQRERKTDYITII
jgi:hypothetical protein